MNYFMLNDKELKIKYKKIFSDKYAEYYPIKILKNLGMVRNQCSKCGKFFWNVNAKRKICGDSNCEGGYSFIGNSPAKVKMDYIDSWMKFSSHMKSLGYTPIKRYPVAARWRDDVFFVQASIDDFIPYVINGTVEPPANPLVVPQLCLRFNDIENVGVTGSHNVLFTMIGQHQFRKKNEYRIDEYIEHLLSWFIKGMKLPIDELTIHEDAWAGSGNFGPCMEFFSRGLEIANQVYMQFEQTETGYKDLGLKVLDMGMGQERLAWFTGNKLTAYESSFPIVCKKLKNQAGIDVKDFSKFMPYAGMLNIDETPDVNIEWEKISAKIGIDKNVLKNELVPLMAIYAIAEHTRALLVAITDGVLPSNVGGGYNLRVIFRRALGFNEKYKFNFDFKEIAKLHAGYLMPIFPELKNGLESFNKILDIETDRFSENKKRGATIIKKLEGKKITPDKLTELYESHGITPETLQTMIKTKIKIPEDFYSNISTKHLRKKHKSEVSVGNIKDTEILYYDDVSEFSATVLKVMNDIVILDKSGFYPTSGGQEHDTGTLNKNLVYKVEKSGNVVIHYVSDAEKIFRKCIKVNGKIDMERRHQLAIHHTTAHLINSAARKILGPHVYQAGAHKDVERAHLDITHYQGLTEDLIMKIENEANAIARKNIKVEKFLMKRSEAEKIFGMNIYQGGAIPGNNLRIIRIGGYDVEACSGIHVDETKAVGKIYITSTERIQDGIVRINYVSGKTGLQYIEKQRQVLEECSDILSISMNKVFDSSLKLYEKWKKIKKEMKHEIKQMPVTTGKRIVQDVGIASFNQLKEIARNSGKEFIILFGHENDKINIFAASSCELDAGKILKEMCEIMNGKGGGTKIVAQGFGKNNLNKAMEKAKLMMKN